MIAPERRNGARAARTIEPDLLHAAALDRWGGFERMEFAILAARARPVSWRAGFARPLLRKKSPPQAGAAGASAPEHAQVSSGCAGASKQAMKRTAFSTTKR